jgi:hypothetical protein
MKPSYEELERRVLELEQEARDRKEIENALRESRELFRKTFESQIDAIFILNKDVPPKITDCNRSAEQIFGYSREDLVGETTECLHVDADALREFQSQLYSKTPDPGFFRLHDFRMKRKDGRIFHSEHTVVPLTNAKGRRIGWVSVVRDITGWKKAAEALHESEKRYRQLFNHAPAGIYEVDFVNQRWVAVNDVMCEYTGYTKEEFLSMNPSELLTEESKALYVSRIQKMLAGESVPESVEYKIRQKNGDEFWVALNSKPVVENGMITGATAVVHDITERRLAEDVLRKSEERLRLLSTELMKIQENERSRISKELHDELGQSLALLKHRVRSFEKDFEGSGRPLSAGSEGVLEFVDQIIEKVRRLSRDLNPSILDDLGIGPALQSLVETFTEEYSTPVVFEMDDIEGLFSREGARNLFRISQEALTNIAKHAEAKGVTFTIRKEREEVTLLIEDEGKGFDVVGAKKKNPAQKGLGLTVMEERAYLMGGTLVIRSRINTGTTVLLRIPIKKIS